MTFREATDRLSASGVPLVAVAQAFGVTPNTISRWRSAGDRTQRNYLTPPDDWPATVERVAEQHASRFEQHSDTLRQLAREVRRG